MSNTSKILSEINQIAVNIKLQLGNASTIKEGINKISTIQERLQIIKSHLDSELQKKWKWTFEDFKHNLSGSIKQGMEGLKNDGIQKFNSVMGYAGKGLDIGGQIFSFFDGGIAASLAAEIGKMMTDNFLENGVGKRPESFNDVKMSEKEKLLFCLCRIENILTKGEKIKQIGEEILANNELINILDNKTTIEVLYKFNRDIKKEIIGDISDKYCIDFLDIDNQIKKLEECLKIPFNFEEPAKMRQQVKIIIQQKSFIREIDLRIDRTKKIIESTNSINVDIISSLLFLLGNCITELEFNALGEVVLKYYGIRKVPSEILQACVDIKQKIDPLLSLADQQEKLATRCFKEPAYMKRMAKEARWKYRLIIGAFVLFIVSIILLFTHLRIWSITTLLTAVISLLYPSISLAQIAKFVTLCTLTTLLIIFSIKWATILFIIFIFYYGITQTFRNKT